jgi:ABC-type transport system substrate-binding protein
MKKIFLLFVLTGSAIAFIFSSTWFSNTRVKNNELNLIVARDLTTLDPAIVFNDDGLSVMTQAQDSLYQYHYLKRPFEIIPALAASLPQISKNGLEYLIKLRPEVRYHDHPAFAGKKRYVQAEDIANQIKRLAYAPLNSPGTWLFDDKLLGFKEFSKTKFKNFEQMLNTPMKGITVVDDLTIKLTLSRPEPNMLYFLAMGFITPMPRELIDYVKNDFSKTLVGTGAYQYLGYKDNVHRFERFSHFRSEYYPSSGDRIANTQNLLKSSNQLLPFIDKINFHFVEEEEEKWEKFKNKEVDIVNVPKQLLEKIIVQDYDFYQTLKADGIEISHFPKHASRWLAFNMQDPIWGKNKYLRQAVAYAIDYEKYLAMTSKSTNLMANSIYNPSVPGYRPGKSSPYAYDLLKAKDLMRKSGYGNGEKKLPTLVYSTRGVLPEQIEEAQFIQQSLQVIGIDVQIDILNFSEFIQLGRAGKLQFFTDNWIYDYPDAENILQLLISKNHPGINKSGYSNKQVDKLYDELSRTIDPFKRADLIHHIESMVEADQPWIMLMYESAFVLYRSDIKNFRKSFFIRNYLKYLKRE